MGAPITHRGTVEKVEGGMVHVTITASSACGSCQARQACGLAETQEKQVVVPCDDADAYVPGEQVTVGVRRSIGLRAVLLGYVGALVVLLAMLGMTIGVWGWSEGKGAVAALGTVAAYYVALWSLRKKIEHTIKFTITKHQ